MKTPFLFEETSQKIYSFEGFVFYSQKHWMEASDILGTESFLQWLLQELKLSLEHEKLLEILEHEKSATQKLLHFFEMTGLIDPVVLNELQQEIRSWEDQPIQIQHKLRGDRAFYEKRYHQALHLYQLAQVELFNPLVEHNIGAAYMHLHFFVEAEKAFHLALKHCDALEIHLNLIRLLKITCRTNEAIARIKDLLKRYSNWEIYYEYGILYGLKGMYEVAYEAFLNAYQIERRYEILVKMVELSVILNHTNETSELIENLKEENYEAYVISKSHTLVQSNQLDEAIECLEDGLISIKESKKIALELSKVCRQRKQIIKAIHAITKAQDDGASEDELLYEMALIAKKAGNRKDYDLKINELQSLWKSSVRCRSLQ